MKQRPERFGRLSALLLLNIYYWKMSIKSKGEMMKKEKPIVIHVVPDLTEIPKRFLKGVPKEIQEEMQKDIRKILSEVISSNHQEN